MSAASSSRVLLVLAALLGSAAAAQSVPVVLSIDTHLTHPVTAESWHEILPLAVFDGTRFQPVQETDPVLGESSRVQELLTLYPVAQVLHHGARIGEVMVSEVRLQGFQCTQLVVGTGDYAGSGTLPASEIQSSAGRRENGERVEYATETFLALSRAIDGNELESRPVITAVTDPEELRNYATEVERVAPRPELYPLAVDETRAYPFTDQNGVLVLRTRQSAAKVQLQTFEIQGTLYTDGVIVRDGPGERAVFPLQGFPAQLNGMGGGESVVFIDAFALRNGAVYFAFKWYVKESVTYTLYELGAAGDTKLVFDTVMHGC